MLALLQCKHHTSWFCSPRIWKSTGLLHLCGTIRPYTKQNPAYFSILGFTILVMTLKVYSQQFSLMLLCTFACGTHGSEQLQWLSKTSVHFTLLALNIKLADTCLQIANGGWCHYICHCNLGPFFSHIMIHFWAYGVLCPVSLLQFALDL